MLLCETMSQFTLTQANLEVVDAKLAGYEYKVSEKVEINTFDPDVPTVRELKRIIPCIFANGKSLDNYFHQELFIAAHLATLTFQGVDYRSGSPIFLNIINLKINELRRVIDENIEELYQQYEMTKYSMNLQIFTNVKKYKSLNNSRLMINGLLNFKMLFQNLIHNLTHLDEVINEINEKIDEWNDNDNDNNNDNISDDVKMQLFVINSNLSCSNPKFEQMVQETILVFSEFVKNFQDKKAILSDDNLYDYEIILFNSLLK